MITFHENDDKYYLLSGHFAKQPINIISLIL